MRTQQTSKGAKAIRMFLPSNENNTNTHKYWHEQQRRWRQNRKKIGCMVMKSKSIEINQTNKSKLKLFFCCVFFFQKKEEQNRTAHVQNTAAHNMPCELFDLFTLLPMFGILLFFRNVCATDNNLWIRLSSVTGVFMSPFCARLLCTRIHIWSIRWYQCISHEHTPLYG